MDGAEAMTPGPRVFRSHNATTTRRKARKVRYCAEGHRIPAGHVYLMHKAFPGHESGYADMGHPVTMDECADCALRYGRERELDYGLGFPDDQEYRYWLGGVVEP